MLMTPPLLDDRGRPTAATTFLLVHRALRRDSGRFPSAVRSLAYGEVDRAGRTAERWRTFRGVLDDHHRAEDTRLFPALLAAESGLTGVLVELGEQHAGLDDLLDRAEASLDVLAARGVDAVARETSVEVMAGLARHLEDHLALEEEHLVPVMLRDPAPFRPSPGPSRQQSARVDDQALAWLAEDLDPVTLAVLAAELPPPARAGLPDLLDRQRRSAALVWGEPYAEQRAPGRRPPGVHSPEKRPDKP